MDLPKYHETFIPILEVLSHGQAVPTNELRQLVRDKYYNDLPSELAHKKTKNGNFLPIFKRFLFFNYKSKIHNCLNIISKFI